jgi:hypothetical protein
MRFKDAAVIAAALAGILASVAVVSRPLGAQSRFALGAEPGAGTARPALAKLLEFDAPGATKIVSSVCAPYCGTVAYANNAGGSVTGFYTDANVVPHGFIRHSSGDFEVFNAPGAGLGKGLNEGTAGYAISRDEYVAGQYEDAQLVYHGFIRNPNKTFVTFDAPGAGTAANQGTLAVSINLEHATAGEYYDAKSVLHGFVRSQSGMFATFDPPGSIYTYVCNETCLNDAGAATGFYYDSTQTAHGFIRRPDGKIITIDAPGAGKGSGLGTLAGSINAWGAITGYYADAKGTLHGYVRLPDGRFSAFDVPGAAGTGAFSINDAGAVTGIYFYKKGIFHGFERSLSGTIAKFDAPGAGTAGGPGTRPSTNNASGTVSGWWADPTGLNHGFVWWP